MINDTTLLSIIDTSLSNSMGGYSSDLENDQALAMDYYHGRPYGDEQDGLSSVVTRDVMETVEWTMPSLMRVFAGGEKVAEFDAVGQEDEEQSVQETDYINHVFNKENDGFTILYTWFKSALLQKNSYLKVWVEDEEKTTTETYENLTEMGLAQVLEQEGAVAIESDTHYESVIQPDPMTGQPIEVQVELYDVKVEITTTSKKVKVANVPNEEMRISRNTSGLSLRGASFVSHSRPMTQSELIGMGFDKKLVKSLASYDGGKDGELEIARDQLNDEDSTQYDPADDSMRLIEVDECYIEMDMKETGRSQLWKVLRAGNEILEKEECDFIPFPALSPILMPHQHVGLSEADLVMDIQRIRSVLTRQMLDNLYLSNNPEKEVLDGKVNMDDLLTSRAGGVKRVKQMESIRPLVVPFTAGASIPMLDILDNMREFRTGIGRNNMGLDANTLAQSTKGAFMGAMEQANQRLEMLARTFAETGVRELFLMMHELIVKHYDQSIPVKLNNKFVIVNPLEWKERTNMTVVVGLGTGNRDAELQQLLSLAEKQELHLAQGSPLVTLKNVYNTYARLIDRSGLKSPEMFFTDPDSQEAKQLEQQKAQQKQQDPNEMLIQAQLKIEQDKVMMDNKELEHKTAMEIEELEIKKREISLKEYEAGMKPQIEAAQIEAKRYEADVKQETALAVERLKGGADLQDVINTAIGGQQAENDAQLDSLINGLLGEMASLRNENAEALAGLNSGFTQQLQTLAAQAGRKKRIIYDDAGEPIGVEPVID